MRNPALWAIRAIMSATMFFWLSGALIQPLWGEEAREELVRKFNQLYEAGHFKEAARIGERALRMAESAYGADSPKVAENLDALAVTYDALEDYKKAQPYIERALGIFERTSGRESKDLIKPLNTLGMNYSGQEKYAEAEDTFNRALAIAQKVLPKDDTLLATVYNNLGQLHSEQGQYKEASEDYERALEVLEMDQGKAYWAPEVAITKNNLAHVRKEQGNYDDAMMLYEQSLAVLERGVGHENPNHPYIAGVLENLAKLYELKGWKEEAQAAAERAKRIRAGSE